MSSTEQTHMESDKPTTGVPSQVIEQFLKVLETKPVPVDVTARLKKTLLEQGNVSYAALKGAIFPDNNPDI